MDPHKISVSNETHHWWEFIMSSIKLYTRHKYRPDIDTPLMSQKLTTSNIYKESSFWRNLILIRLQCRLDALDVCICSVHHLVNWRSGPWCWSGMGWWMLQTPANCLRAGRTQDKGREDGGGWSGPHSWAPVAGPDSVSCAACHWSGLTNHWSAQTTRTSDTRLWDNGWAEQIKIYRKDSNVVVMSVIYLDC